MSNVIAIVGMCGSGKSVASEELENRGWAKVYFGGLTYEQMEKEGIPYTPENDKMMRNRMREDYGMAAYAILSLPKIKEDIKNSNVVIDGLYSWDEYKVLKDELGEDLKLICIITDKNIRYNRLRAREKRPYTFNESRDRDLNEIENLAKGGPIAYADYYIDNNGTIEEYKKRLDWILKDIEEVKLNES